MAEAKAKKTAEEQADVGNGSSAASSAANDTRKAAVRAAAIAAASGATAFAAKKALSGRSSGDDDEEGGTKPARKSGDESLITTMAASSWDAARDSLVPMLADAATHAGEYVAKNAPDVVTETIVPKFIRGFERARKESSDEDDGGDEE